MKIVLVVLVLLTALVVTGALLAGPNLRDKLSMLRPEPSSTKVRIERARRTELIETVSAPGEIEPHTRVQIAAVVSARITDVPFREGEVVRKDDIVCQLDDRDLRTLLTSANARRDGERSRLGSEQRRLEGLRGNVVFARTELERMQTLFAAGDVSRRELDQAQERVDDLETSAESTQYAISTIESSLAAAEAEIERAQEGLNNTVIVAPMDGVITWLNVEVGEVVTGSTTNPGTVLMTIADLSRMVMKAQIAESDIANVAVGQEAKIYINAYPDDTYGGTTRQIALQRSGNADGTGFFETEVEIDLRGRQIYSGLVANVDVEVARHTGVVVPYQAIVTRDVESLPAELREHDLVDHTKKKVHVVYRVIDGKAVCTPVKPGASDLTHRIIEEGLAEDEALVVGPYKVLETIKHDERVSEETAAGATAGRADREKAADESPAGDGEGETAGDGAAGDR